MRHRIGFISEHSSPVAALGGADSGGQNVYVAELSRNLAALGYQVDVFTRWEDPALPEIVPFAPGVRIIHIAAGPLRQIPKETLLPYMPEFIERMLPHAQHYALFHAHYYMSALVAAELKQRTGTPFVVTYHSLGRIRRMHVGAADRSPEARVIIEAETAQAANRVVALCPQEMDDLTQFYAVAPENISVIACGVSSEQFYPVAQDEARRSIGLAQDERIILQLGRIVERKGIDTVIEALALLHNRYGTVARLVVVGGESDEPDPEKTPELGKLMALAHTLGLNAWVTFAGRKDQDVARLYYAAADVFVTVPWYEPFGITPLEAMACGTPVIGARVGGIQYTVLDGETGYLVPPKDAEALAARLHDVLTQPEKRILREQAIARINTLFLWKHIAGEIAALYEQVMAQHPTTAVPPGA